MYLKLLRFLFVFCLIIFPQLSVAQQAGTWFETLSLSYLRMPNYAPGFYKAFPATTYSSRLNPRSNPPGGSFAAGVTDDNSQTVTNSISDLATLIGYKLTIGYYFADSWATGFEYSKNQSTITGRFKYSMVNDGHIQRAGNINPRVDDTVNIDYDFTTYTGFIRKEFLYGLHAQAGLAFRNWQERRSHYGQYVTKWPSLGLQLGVGGKWRFNNLTIGTGIEMIYGGKPTLASFNRESFRKETNSGMCSGTKSNLVFNINICDEIMDSISDSIKKNLNKKSIIYGFSLDFGYSLQ